MKITRRNFLGTLGTAALGGTIARARDANAVGTETGVMEVKTDGAVKTTTICPYCAVGCGMIVSQKGGRVVNVEGDADHPVNQGSLCSKGSSLSQVANNHRRLDRPLYRAPGSSGWETKSWEWTLARIAQNVKKTRDATFVETENGAQVNRTEGIASLGGAALDNEECYLIAKLMRGLGVVYIEHQARI